MSDRSDERPKVFLSSNLTQVSISPEDRAQAINDAHWVTCSPCEWKWSTEQQARMAQYCLWAAQRLVVLESLAGGAPLRHRS